MQVSAGTYAGTSVNPTNSGTAGSPITFAANPGVTISGGTRSFALSNRNYITIRGFTITGTSSYGIYVSGGSNVTITGNTESFAGTPISAPAIGIYLSNLNGGLVQGNITHDNSAHGIYLTGTTTGVTVAGNTSYHNAYQYQRNANGIDDIAPGNSIIGNVTYNNEDTGINIYTGGNNALVANNVTYNNGDHGIDDFNVTGGRIIGNTVYFNCTDRHQRRGHERELHHREQCLDEQRDRGRHQPDPDSGQPEYRPAVLHQYRATAGSGTSASTTRRRPAPRPITTSSTRAVPGPGTRGPGPGTTRLSALQTATGQESAGKFANPRFVNASGGNFQLSAGSPAIDSANSLASGEQATDILASTRADDPNTPNTGNPAGSFYDRGAYEYQPSGGGGGTQTPPTAALAVSPSSGNAPLAVTADASASTAGSSPISSYSFDFGDGTIVGPQAGATAHHTYPSAGTYTVTVTVTDGNNMTSTASRTVSATTAASSNAKYINQIATNTSTNSHTSGSVTVWRTGGVTAGDLMVVTVQLTGTSATGAVSGTDSKGDTLHVASDVSDASGDRLVTLYGVAASGLAVNDLITVSFPTASSYRIMSDEVSGVSSLDVQSAASGTASAFSSGATATTARVRRVRVRDRRDVRRGRSVTWNTGWTALANYTLGSKALGRAYQIPSGTGSFTASGTGSGSRLAEVVAFK